MGLVKHADTAKVHKFRDGRHRSIFHEDTDTNFKTAVNLGMLNSDEERDDQRHEKTRTQLLSASNDSIETDIPAMITDFGIYIGNVSDENGNFRKLHPLSWKGSSEGIDRDKKSRFGESFSNSFDRNSYLGRSNQSESEANSGRFISRKNVSFDPSTVFVERDMKSPFWVELNRRKAVRRAMREQRLRYKYGNRFTFFDLIKHVFSGQPAQTRKSHSKSRKTRSELQCSARGELDDNSASSQCYPEILDPKPSSLRNSKMQFHSSAPLRQGPSSIEPSQSHLQFEASESHAFKKNSLFSCSCCGSAKNRE
jgi:hypothetical protein